MDDFVDEGGRAASYPWRNRQPSRIPFAAPGYIPRGAASYLTAGADFADCMILAESASAGHELVTFDRKLGKLAGARLLTT